jgi:hypothetical protein
MTLRSAATPVAAFAIGGALLLLAPGAAAAAPNRPNNVTATRDATDPHKVKIGWDAVAGVSRYNVSVFDGDTDRVTIVTPPNRTLEHIQPDSCHKLRVNVGSRDRSGAGSTSYNTWLYPLAPGGVSVLKAERAGDGKVLSAAWRAPTWAGYGPAGEYHVQLLSADKKVVFEGTVKDTNAHLTGLDPARDYTLLVDARNAYGSCVTAKLPVGSLKPNAATALKAVRDTANPKRISVSWNAPGYTGTGGISHYMIGYGVGTPTRWVKCDSAATVLDLDTESTWVMQVVAYNGFGGGRASGLLKLTGTGPATPPTVTPTNHDFGIRTSGSRIYVDFAKRVGDDPQYPKMVVRVTPAADPDGYTEEQWVAPGAADMNLGDVPAGLYLVQVNAANATSELELGRQWINIGDAGVVAANAWTQTTGKLAFTGDTITADGTSETRALTNANRSDQALSSTVTLKEGRGYGFWTRAGISKNNKISGYVVEYDTQYAVGKTVQPTMVLRMFSESKECSRPLVATKLTPQLIAAGPHKVSIIAKGDVLTATLDGAIVVNVPSLAAAVTSAGCKYAAPTGTQQGIKTWNKAAVQFGHYAVN